MINNDIENYLLKKKNYQRTSANQMQPFEGYYDAPVFIIDLTVVLLHC